MLLDDASDAIEVILGFVAGDAILAVAVPGRWPTGHPS